MTETYCVVAEVSGFATDVDAESAVWRDMNVDKDTYNAALVDIVAVNTGAHDVVTLVRDDGTGEVVVVWEPDAEADGTQSWQQAKDSVETVRSAIAGAGFATVNPIKVELRDYYEPAKSPAKALKTTKKAAATKS